MKHFLDQLPRGPFWIYFVAAIFFNFGFALFFFLFNVYLLGLGYNERTLGLIGSYSLTGRLIATLPIGWLAQRFGLRRTLFTAVLAATVITLCRATFTQTSAQFALAVCAGFVLCAWGVCLSPAVAALTTEIRRPLAFSLIFASGIGDAGLGAFAAGRLPGWFMAHAIQPINPVHSERFVLYFGCVIAALALVPLGFLKFPSPLPATKLSGRLIFPASLFLNRFLPATAAWAVVLGAFPPFANVFFTRHLHLPLHSMGSVLSVSQAVQFAAILAAPFFFRRAGFRNSILLTQLLTAVALVSLGGSHTLLAASCSYWFYTAAQNSNEPAIASLLMDRVAARDRNNASSFAALSTAGAQIFASTAVGAGIVRFGYSPVLYAISAFALLAAFLFYRLPTWSSGLPGTLNEQ